MRASHLAEDGVACGWPCLLRTGSAALEDTDLETLLSSAQGGSRIQHRAWTSSSTSAAPTLADRPFDVGGAS